MGCSCSRRVPTADHTKQILEQVTPFDKRGCTDLLCLVLFIVGWFVFVVVTVAGLADGNPSKLYKPRDFSGAYCGVAVNWNGGPDLASQGTLTYTMNVSATTDQIAKQLLCSSGTSRFLLGGSSPLSATQQDAYACACCLAPCKQCAGSHNLGKGGDIASISSLSSVVSGRMAELTSLADGGSSLFNPGGMNGDFVSGLWNEATQYLIPVCMPSCNVDYTSIVNNTRTYQYRPAADSPLRAAWDALAGSSSPDAGNLPATITSQFSFQALPKDLCPYGDVFCVPMPGLKFEELPGDYCGFQMSAEVVNVVGEAASRTYASLGGNAFASMSVETFGTWMGDFEKSIDSFVVVSLLAFIIGILFLVLLRFFVGCCVWVSVLLVLILLLFGGGVIFVRSGQCAEAGLFESGRQVAVAVAVASATAVTDAVNGDMAPSEKLEGDGRGYVGVQQRSRSGYLCKDWSEAGPSYWPVLKEQANLKSNFCRNPYNSSSVFQASTIWCFTTDANKKWELCSPVGVVQPECTRGYAVESQTGRDVLKVVGIILWCLAGIWVLLVCCFRSRIQLAIALNKVGADFVSHSPHVVLIPLVQALVGVVWALVWAFSACFLLSQVPESYTPTKAFATYAEAYGTLDTPGACTDKWPTGFVYRDETCAPADPKCWRCGPPRYVFDVRFFISFFMYLWNNAFIIALGQTCIAGAVGVWFFTPNNKKGSVPSVSQSVFLCFRYHTGSLAFGALILAIVQFIRYVLMYFEKQAQAQKNRVMACLLKVFQYALWCLEKFIKFLNKNAYIQIALRGTNFCTSAKKAFEIITQNVLRFGVVATLGRVIHYIGILCITAGTTIVGYFILRAMHEEVNPLVPLVLYAAVGYLIGKLYMSVFGMSVDTSLQCVIVAEELDHDGSFVPSALRGVLPARLAWDRDGGDKT